MAAWSANRQSGSSAGCAAASRSLHLHQPHAWLHHKPHLRVAQTLKPTFRACAARTRSLPFKPLFRTFRRPQTSSENLLAQTPSEKMVSVKLPPASRSLHLHQPRAWLRHTLPADGTNLKPRCRVCAVRTHAFFAVQTIVLNFQTTSNVYNNA